MCGIIACAGTKPAIPILLPGLRRLEYRGYDSAGIALFLDGELVVMKQVGGVNLLEASASRFNLPQVCVGIAHTRWATHGEVNEANAHPHGNCKQNSKCSQGIELVHNGTLDNFQQLREALLQRGHILRTDTDTELIAHLIAEAYNGDPLRAIRAALSQVEGTYGLAILMEDVPDQIFFARNGSPLVLGLSPHGNFVASDPLAFREHTDQMIELPDGSLGWVSAKHHHIVTFDDVPLLTPVQTIEWSLETATQGNHEHFMGKEIAEQPTMLAHAMRGRLQADGSVKLGGLLKFDELLVETLSHSFIGAGTSLHAGMIAKVLFQEIAGVHADWENASELANQKHPCFRDRTAFWAISQSGETKDLLDALQNILPLGVPSLGIVNRVGSAIARMTGKGVYIHAGLEIAVASTKAFTNQVLTLNLIALYLRQLRQVPKAAWLDRYLDDLRRIPALVTEVLAREPQIIQTARAFAGYPNFLFLGRGINYPTALEGALKLKEIAYVNAIGYSTGEMKHGPIALIDGGFPTLVIALKQDDHYAQVVTNIQQIRARHGRIIAIATDGDEGIRRMLDSVSDDVLYIPQVDYFLSPILAVIPLQLLAYHIAKIRGLNPDRPRNLAKSVTVQ